MICAGCVCVSTATESTNSTNAQVSCHIQKNNAFYLSYATSGLYGLSVPSCVMIPVPWEEEMWYRFSIEVWVLYDLFSAPQEGGSCSNRPIRMLHWLHDKWGRLESSLFVWKCKPKFSEKFHSLSERLYKIHWLELLIVESQSVEISRFKDKIILTFLLSHNHSHFI